MNIEFNLLESIALITLPIDHEPEHLKDFS